MLPSALDTTDEGRKMDLAYVYEAYNALKSDATAAERRYRQSLVAARSQELKMNAARDKAQQLKNRVDILVGLALDEAAASTRSTDMIDSSVCGSDFSSELMDYTGKGYSNSRCS
jgi:hypothetical protein